MQRRQAHDARGQAHIAERVMNHAHILLAQERDFVVAQMNGMRAQQIRSYGLPEGKPREVRFRYKAEGSGEAVLRFAVSGGGEQDAVEQRLPVKIPTQLEAVAIAGDTQSTAKEALSDLQLTSAYRVPSSTAATCAGTCRWGRSSPVLTA